MATNDIFESPIMRGQTEAESPFARDGYIGHTMPSGRDFIGENGYIGMDEMISNLQKTRKRCVLNIGDSSTSGWDSYVVLENRERARKCEPLIPAFFRYRTYPDCLRDLIGDEFEVINAGVPAHTSIQGKRRLEAINKKFKSANLRVDYVTVYYGNNDSACNGNVEDREWLGCGTSRTFWNPFGSRIVTRVSPHDYKRAMKDIVEYSVDNRMSPILIEPPTPIYWKPGARIEGEDFVENLSGEKWLGTMLSLFESESVWEDWIGKSYSKEKHKALEKASELDYVTPRIKSAYRRKLLELSRQKSLPMVRIELDRSEDDKRYFLDYCHPIGEANEKIASGIAGYVKEYESGKRDAGRYRTPAIYRMLDLIEKMGIAPTGTGKQDNISDKMYPIF